MRFKVAHSESCDTRHHHLALANWRQRNPLAATVANSCAVFFLNKNNKNKHLRILTCLIILSDRIESNDYLTVVSTAAFDQVGAQGPLFQYAQLAKSSNCPSGNCIEMVKDCPFSSPKLGWKISMIAVCGQPASWVRTAHLAQRCAGQGLRQGDGSTPTLAARTARCDLARY